MELSDSSMTLLVVNLLLPLSANGTSEKNGVLRSGEFLLFYNLIS